MERYLPSPELLHKILRYNPKTGLFTFKPRPASMFFLYEDPNKMHEIWTRRFKNKKPFVLTEDGHLIGYLFFHPVFDQEYNAHDVAAAMFRGRWTDETEVVCHNNSNKSDNRAVNLRIKKVTTQ